MDAKLWRTFFEISYDVLGEGARTAALSQNWCSWTTFDRLKVDAGYWSSGLPNRADLFESYVGDKGVWSQPFLFDSLAHVIVPGVFFWERIAPGAYESGEKIQAIGDLSHALTTVGLPHRLTDLVLEIKLY